MFFEIVAAVMKAPQRSIIFPLLFWATVATAVAETPAELENRATEQERQIRQLEVQNQRLRDQIERLQEQLAAQEDTPAPAPAPTAEAETPDEAAPATPPAEEPETAVHIVRAGESLSKIASRHGTTTAELAKLNGIRNPSLIREGQRLKLPTREQAAEPSPSQEVVTGTHTVKEGETFFSIARTYGLSVEALQAANPGVNPTALSIGQELKLSAKKADAPASDESTAPDANAADERASVAETKPVIRSIPIDENISFGDFAARHQMEPAKLNALNGLQLEPKTVLATGSRLYVSAQPLE